MKTLVDGDIVAFRCSASAENEPEEIAVLRTHRQLEEILYLTNSSTYEVILTGSNNFRKQIYPEYKANRKDKPKPVHLQACREYLAKEWNAKITDGCEADDILGVLQDESSCICSIDKDLLQIPGKHFNFVKNEWYDVTLAGGIRHFYEQLLKGDKTDNIPGVEGIGEKKAQRLLEGCEIEQEMFDVCRNMYNDDQKMLMYGKCLWIWRTDGDIWNPTHLLTGGDQSNSEVVTTSDSTQ